MKKCLTTTTLIVAMTLMTTARSAAPPNITRPATTDIEKLHALFKPAPGESRWMEIDWHPTVWEGRKKAADEGKPLFLWAGSGGAPAAGC